MIDVLGANGSSYGDKLIIFRLIAHYSHYFLLTISVILQKILSSGQENSLLYFIELHRFTCETKSPNSLFSMSLA